jgi:hypothetical protein
VRVQTVDAPDVLFLNEKLSDVDRCEWSMAGSGKQVVTLDVGQMTVPAKGNTAFDLATLFTTDTGEPHLLLIECKFSAADASTVLAGRTIWRRGLRI